MIGYSIKKTAKKSTLSAGVLLLVFGGLWKLSGGGFVNRRPDDASLLSFRTAYCHTSLAGESFLILIGRTRPALRALRATLFQTRNHSRPINVRNSTISVFFCSAFGGMLRSLAYINAYFAFFFIAPILPLGCVTLLPTNTCTEL